MRKTTCIGWVEWEARKATRPVLLMVGLVIFTYIGTLGLDKQRKALGVHHGLSGFGNRGVLR